MSLPVSCRDFFFNLKPSSLIYKNVLCLETYQDEILLVIFQTHREPLANGTEALLFFLKSCKILTLYFSPILSIDERLKLETYKELVKPD